MKLSIAILIVCFAVTAQGASRIVGGSDAPDGKYPYAASLQENGQHFCTGSIIDKRFVLTAAHCFELRASNIEVKVGSNDQLDPNSGRKYQVEKIIEHRDYYEFYDDIALVLLSEEIEFSEQVQPIPITKTDISKSGTPVLALGWGEKSYGRGSSRLLQELLVNLVGQRNCREGNKILNKSVICTLKEFGYGVCRGDSGSPLVADGALIGVASAAAPCARGVPDVYTRVYHYIGWINENVARY